MNYLKDNMIHAEKGNKSSVDYGISMPRSAVDYTRALLTEKISDQKRVGVNSTVPANSSYTNSSYILKKIDFGVKCHSNTQSKGRKHAKTRVKLNPGHLVSLMFNDRIDIRHRVSTVAIRF